MLKCIVTVGSYGMLSIYGILRYLGYEGRFFFEEELATVLKGLKNNKAPGADSVVNEFLKYGRPWVRNKLLKIMNMIF